MKIRKGIITMTYQGYRVVVRSKKDPVMMKLAWI